jgi:DNA-directed RNA polymerase beta subunit
MKREVWLNKRKKTTANDIVKLMRALGYTDKQIKDFFKKEKQK